MRFSEITDFSDAFSQGVESEGGNASTVEKNAGYHNSSSTDEEGASAELFYDAG